MTLDQINALTFNESIYEVAERLKPQDGYFSLNREIPEGQLPIWEDLDFFYQDGTAFARPDLQVAMDEFDIYKQELIDAENARLAEIARVEDIKLRWAAITDIRAIDSAQNPALELKRIIEEDDQTKLSELESLWAAYQANLALEVEKKARKEMGRKARKMCEECLDVIAGHNLQNDLSATQIDQMTASFADILTALKNNRPETAKTLINQISPDGVLVTQEMKDEALSVLNL